MQGAPTFIGSSTDNATNVPRSTKLSERYLIRHNQEKSRDSTKQSRMSCNGEIIDYNYTET